jgi:translocation and assembly module TamB
MRRPARIALISLSTLVALLLIAIVSVIVIGNSDWLREKFRQRIIAEAEDATGGRLEIGAFKLDWRTLTAEIDDAVLHGKEPPGTAPFLAIKRVVIGFRILSLMEKTFDVARLEAESPQLHLIIQADGSTNVPEPKTPPHEIPKLIMDLRIGRFNLANGLAVAERPGSRGVSKFNFRGENLAAKASYNRKGKRYDGDVSIAAVNLALQGLGEITAQVSARASMELNRVTVSSLALKSGASEIDLSDVAVDNFNAPVTTANCTSGRRQNLQAG